MVLPGSEGGVEKSPPNMSRLSLPGASPLVPVTTDPWLMSHKSFVEGK
jgi:hypothetical protein